jgi:hypothetical protein
LRLRLPCGGTPFEELGFLLIPSLLGFRTLGCRGGPGLLDLEDFCWGGRDLLTWLILGGDDCAAERGEHVGERDGVLGAV